MLAGWVENHEEPVRVAFGEMMVVSLGNRVTPPKMNECPLKRGTISIGNFI